MSQFTGRQGKGAMAARRAVKRADAEARNALAKPERKSKAGQVPPVTEPKKTRRGARGKKEGVK